MKHAAQATTANPFVVGAGGTGGDVMNVFNGEAMRAWMGAATRLQAESAAFWTGRMSKDVAAMSALARCTTPAAAVEAQMQYAREAWADFEGEGQRLLRIVNEAAAFKLPDGPRTAATDR